MNRTLSVLAALLLLAGGCEKGSLLPSRIREPRLTGRHPDRRPDTSATAGPHLYLIAVVFADGYDWKTDSLPAQSGAELLLLRDGEEVLRLPAGESREPGRHRVLGGHLFQVLEEGQETVFSRDGKALFRFPGKAALKGLFARGDTLHSLWQNLDGGGIFYRVGKELRYEDAAGFALGAEDAPERPWGCFSEDANNLYYSYYVPVKTADGVLREYRTMAGSLPFRTLPAGNVFEVCDIRVSGGVLCRVERRTAGASELALVQGKDVRNLPVGEGETASAGRLVSTGGRVLARYRLTGPEGSRLVVSDGDSLVLCPEGRVRELCLDGEDAAWLLSDGSGGIGAICRKGREPILPGSGLTLLDSRCVLLRGGHLFVALTGRDGRHHCLYIDETAVSYAFNGYFSSVWWE